MRDSWALQTELCKRSLSSNAGESSQRIEFKCISLFIVSFCLSVLCRRTQSPHQ